MALKQLFNPNDAPSAKMAELFATIGDRRYSMLNAKKFTATANVENAEIKTLGAVIKKRKTTGVEIKLTMTVYKCSDMFDALIEEFKNTGVLPTFDVQVTQEDPATNLGRSTKVYNDCVIDGELILSMIDADGSFIEQEITAYAMDYNTAETYTDPAYM